MLVQQLWDPINAGLHWYFDHARVIFASVIIGAVIAEKLWQWARNRDLQWRSISTSAVSGFAFLSVKTVLGKAGLLGLSLLVYQQYRLTTLDLSNPLIWVGVFLVRDFVYYWVHRAEHTVRLLWASHLIHHSPDTIGMSTAVRVPWMEACYKPFFSLWMPLAGFNPLYAIAFDVFASTLSQLQHTEARKAKPGGCIQAIFVTPSHHRVHHGYNPEYIDKNFGAVLIIWDRLFGTFAPEVAPVKFGVGERDAINSPTAALVGGYPRLVRDVRRVTGPAAKLRTALRMP